MSKTHVEKCAQDQSRRDLCTYWRAYCSVLMTPLGKVWKAFPASWHAQPGGKRAQQTHPHEGRAPRLDEPPTAEAFKQQTTLPTAGESPCGRQHHGEPGFRVINLLLFSDSLCAMKKEAWGKESSTRELRRHDTRLQQSDMSPSSAAVTSVAAALVAESEPYMAVCSLAM
jgi:hypothetical protein